MIIATVKTVVCCVLIAHETPTPVIVKAIPFLYRDAMCWIAQEREKNTSNWHCRINPSGFRRVFFRGKMCIYIYRSIYIHVFDGVSCQNLDSTLLFAY